ncbi:MAG: hypothetical protein FK734_09500 [Asgard group archaeon]|nr:hypothetical protein [Asgard group archaeon]
MLFVVTALIIGLIFGVIAAGVTWAIKRRLSPAVGIMSGAAFLAAFIIASIQFWFAMPTWGSIILVSLLVIGIGIIVLLRINSRKFKQVWQKPERIVVLLIGALIIVVPAYFGASSAIFKGFDQAKYFDSIIQFPEEKTPFSSIIHGDNLRVVDMDLAIELIQKNNPFGSNSMILDIHIGNVYGKLMWIGAIGSDDIMIGSDNLGRKRNSIFGFVGVDLTDPSEEVVKIEQTFSISSYLVRMKMLERIIWKINPNYRPGDNSYFSMNEDDEMRLLVPYSVSESWRIESDLGLGMTTYLEKLGGVLEFNSDGELVEDYKDLNDLPDYAQIQCYPENWLEYNINKWGRHRKDNHEFAYFFTTSEQLGISWYDDIRVIYDANTGETSQYVMLTQPESESQLLRGAIKANQTGIYFFDWSDLNKKPIDTYNALIHCNTKVEDHAYLEGYDADNYIPILPLLFPIKNEFNNISDYAYVVPMQYSSIRFGGICITNPFDTTGVDTIVKIAGTSDSVEDVLDEAVTEYLELIGSTQIVENEYDENFTIYDLASFIQDGDTIYVAYGNLSYIPEGNTTPVSVNTTVWFTQDYLNISQWQLVIFLEIGDILELNVVQINSIYYCIEIITIT